MLPTISQPHACSCHLCGEKLTAPIYYMGNLYGWSCIKKVNPRAKKVKENWQPCSLISIEIIGEDKRRITVEYLGKKLIGWECIVKLESGNVRIDTTIVENCGNWFVNILAFPNAENIYYNNLTK